MNKGAGMEEKTEKLQQEIAELKKKLENNLQSLNFTLQQQLPPKTKIRYRLKRDLYQLALNHLTQMIDYFKATNTRSFKRFPIEKNKILP